MDLWFEKSAQYECRCIFSSLRFLILSLAYFTVRIQYMVHRPYKIRVSQLFLFSVRLPANSRLSAVKFWGVRVMAVFSSAGGWCQLPSLQSDKFISDISSDSGVLIVSRIPFGTAV